MKIVSVLELRNHLADILDEVRTSRETVVVTRHSTVVATINPPALPKPTDPQQLIANLRSISKNLPEAYRFSNTDPLFQKLIGSVARLPEDKNIRDSWHEHLDEKYG